MQFKKHAIQPLLAESSLIEFFNTFLLFVGVVPHVWRLPGPGRGEPASDGHVQRRGELHCRSRRWNSRRNCLGLRDRFRDSFHESRKNPWTPLRLHHGLPLIPQCGNLPSFWNHGVRYLTYREILIAIMRNCLIANICHGKTITLS